MFERIGRLVVHRPWWTIGAWLVIAVAVIALAPKLESSSDQKDFLPTHYESIQASETAAKAFGEQNAKPSAMLVFTRVDGATLSDSDQAKVGEVVKSLSDRHIGKIESIVTDPKAVSPNKLVQIGQATIDGNVNKGPDKDSADSVKDLREAAKPLVSGTGLQLHIGGDAAQSLDSQDSQNSSAMLIGLGTVAVILVLLLVIFRSPIIALLPIFLIALATAVANGLIADASKLFGLKSDASTSVLLPIVLYGIGTDYLLFLLFRYRERLRAGEDRKQAMVSAVKRVGEAITSAAGVVIVAFLCLTMASMGGFRQMGPALAIAVGVTLIAGLTLLPAVVSLIGPKVFWPSKTWKREPKARISGSAGAVVAKRPVLVAVISGVVMIALAVGAFSFKANFDFGSLPAQFESSKATEDLKSGFPAGIQQPSHVYLRSDTGKPLDDAALKTFGGTLGEVDGVGQAQPPKFNGDHTVADFSVPLKSEPTSSAAMAVAGGPLRDAAHAAAPTGTTAQVGGISSILADIETATERDYRVVFPIAAVLIMLILGLLLRSLVAPWYLMVTVGLGFVSTLGATVWIFQKLQHQSGLMFSMPIILYMFVVAIGTDYNILMVARLREEAQEGHSPREAARRAVRFTGPAIAAAGVILAGTFAALMLSDQSLMKQLGFSVSFGILVSAFVMAMFLTPSLTALFGRAAWWPGHGDRKRAMARGDERDRHLVGSSR
ncbi:MMPL family transporter [Solihabitans fulvus]|uniref:MMPL family transporter n=1 Tax=Solihabitans fulvus TaxID=1892852 RepID=A0A5B2WN84_9PSEU|nr:MMPL family transporter [Solihabitans fulvus]KAA2252434.1 MMPL family transporter [Solihabitans fulvus]